MPAQDYTDIQEDLIEALETLSRAKFSTAIASVLALAASTVIIFCSVRNLALFRCDEKE